MCINDEHNPQINLSSGKYEIVLYRIATANSGDQFSEESRQIDPPLV